jgi:hypothetical protein
MSMSLRTSVLCCVITGFVCACKDTDNGTLRRWHDLDAGTRRDSGARIADAEVEGADATVAESIERLVGTVSESDIRVAAVIEGDRARLFFCGGPTSYATSTRWIVTDIGDDGKFEFDDSGWVVHGTLNRGGLSGSVEQSAEKRGFSAVRVTSGTIAGLYEGVADCGRVGLIVSQPDREADPQGQGACVGEGHAPEQVNPILPVALQEGAIQVTIGEMEVSVHEAAPAPAK